MNSGNRVKGCSCECHTNANIRCEPYCCYDDSNFRTDLFLASTWNGMDIDLDPDEVDA